MSKRLVDITSFAEAQLRYSSQELWRLFDGTRERFNIAEECLDRHSPEKTAITIVLSEGGYENIRFGELAAIANQFANFLQVEGIKSGDRVAIMLEPSLVFYAAFFGAMKAGAIAVPLFTLFGPDGLRLRTDDCRPSLVLVPEDRADLRDGFPDAKVIFGGSELLARLADYDAAFSPTTTANDIAMYQYTSGTTRELPEAIKHGHRALVTVAAAALYGTGIRPGDLFMCPSSPAWGHGLWHGTLAPLGFGVSIVSYAGRFKPKRLAEALADLPVNNLSAAATHYRMLKNSGVVDGRKINLQKLSFTGEALDSDTAAWAEAEFGSPVCSMYGSTEVGVILADYPGAPDYTVRPGALGKPIPGQEVVVLDAEDRICGPNTTGELAVMRRDGWYRTKDLGRVDEDGYFFHAGRADDVIISAGWTMSAVEIEDVLLKHPDIDEAAVIAVPDVLRGQVAKAFIVSQRPESEDFHQAIKSHSKNRLSQHEYPRQIAFVSDLPKTPAGKVNRKILRDREDSEITR